jgi:hypothetical protein
MGTSVCRWFGVVGGVRRGIEGDDSEMEEWYGKQRTPGELGEDQGNEMSVILQD